MDKVRAGHFSVASLRQNWVSALSIVGGAERESPASRRDPEVAWNLRI
jgi:hypothetical protein